MKEQKEHYRCYECNGDIAPRRAELGYDLCMPCGDKQAKNITRTVVPMHKSNYMLVTDLTLLPQLTRPGRGTSH